jgi:hypothetical protein
MINTNPIFSGINNTLVKIVGSNIIGISGAVNSFAISGGPFRIGDLIFGVEGGAAIREVQTPSGNMIIFSGGGGNAVGGVSGFGVDLTTQFTGAFAILGSGGVTSSMIPGPGNVSGIVLYSDFNSYENLLTVWNTIGY